jgi:hypothetical protein
MYEQEMLEKIRTNVISFVEEDYEDFSWPSGQD